MATILVVDDSEFMRRVIRNILEGGGHRVIEARSSEDAIRIYSEQGADIITMDIVMPETDGIETVRRLRDADGSARIIMISALGHQRTVMRALEAGALDFIMKPFTSEDVLESVNAVLQMKI
ncbi:MAG: response regulator [Methanobacteriota archaeon]|nr:MAG: response regulator [Euryarchaeota archaeon]